MSRYLMGDTVRIYQILHNMLLDVLENEEKSNVVLSIEIRKETHVVFSIVNKSKFLSSDEIDRLFIPSSWEEMQITKKEFGFSVIKELIANMKGDFLVTSDKKSGTLYELSLPYVKDLDNKSRKKELKKHLVGKKALVVDTDIKKTEILTYILESFGIEVVFKSSDNLAKFKPHMEGLDFIIIKSEDVTQKVFNFFKNINEEFNLDIVVIHNIFESDHLTEMATRIANEELFSPLILGDVEEVLNNLCLRTNKKKKETFKEELQNFKILDTIKVTRSDFQIFKDKNVLIVENNLVSQQVMSSILSASDLNVYKVENGVAALIFLGERTDIDLILMDIDMPLMDGYEATRMIRKND
ncbi:MAG: response regulator, partial [Flavobacteriaceae bacterium]|nr:response regulator [Flavobacteriaceae bacterium]